MPRNYTDSTKINTEFGHLDNQERNTETYTRLTAGEFQDVAAETKMVFPSGYQLIRVAGNTNDDFEVALVCDTDQSVCYYIKAKIWDDKELGGRPVTQVLLWRTSDVTHNDVTHELTKNVFFEYLLNRYNLVVSDNCQTGDGRRFWTTQMGFALKFGHRVYRYEWETGKTQEITDHAVVRDNSIDLWGDDESYEKILAVISKDPID
ncbi:MAG: hypothetical protein OIF57_00530 [Marinobacterium sp.]|nr:hypothetical protein [Marinobacterium sp.]